jgi:tRNA nucleotidyltransferase (CCA-adding enzyme)
MSNFILQIKDQHRKKLAQVVSISPHLRILLDQIKKSNGLGIMVGGCVRDHLLGIKAKDIDIEVYGVDRTILETILTKKFSVVPVGKTFGIFKVIVTINSLKQSFDVALPRLENKLGRGHKGFIINTDPFMAFFDASSRRDFTINAMGIDPDKNELLDPHEGEKDLKNRVLRHVSEAFKEDPLRVLRAAQFCARFDLRLHDSTKKLCKSLRDELFTLSKERIYEEFKKLLLSKKPSIGLEILRKTDALALFPQLAALIGCPQDPIWHPEGDVWTHTLMVTDEALNIVFKLDLVEEEKLIVVAAALCHDLGKPFTTSFKDGHIKSHGHEQAGEIPTREFLTNMGFPKKLHDDVVALVKEHLKPHQLYSRREEVSDGAIRRLTNRVNIEHLLMVSKADFLGRTTPEALNRFDPSEPWLKKKVQELLGPDLSCKPILLGRHLIALSQKPGVKFSKILREAFEAQMDGKFFDEESGMAWLKQRLKKDENK